MTDKELKRLSRGELIDIIYELQKQKDAADVRVAQLQEKLNQRELCIAQAGSIAEAAIGLNGVFEAAQAAADQSCGPAAARDRTATGRSEPGFH